VSPATTKARVAFVVGACVVALAACSSESSSAAKPKPAATSTAPTTSTSSTTGPAPATKDTQVWLCKPDLPNDPCRADLTTTVIAADGSTTVEKSQPDPDPKIDCFYVYPTVSPQPTPNANLTIEPAETNVAIAQASRYSQTCRVFAPMYRQVTIANLFKRNAESGQIAFGDVAAAWNDYLARYNDGRGVVLIGHSQGSLLLRPLIANVIEPNAAVRTRIVSAILLGGNVLVPTGKDVGGDFKYLAACHSPSEIGCVIAFSTFDHMPPAGSLFGRTARPGMEVLCTNPAALGGGTGALTPYLPARTNGRLALGSQSVTTPWVSDPDLFTGECRNSGGASWLQVDDVRQAGDNRIKLLDSLGPTWGLHLYDGNIALGNLTDIVHSEAAAYLAHN
jgi:hypothetical protein